jgi:hypothetical protein
MAQQAKVTKALRFLKQNPRIPEKGIMYIGRKLREEEEEGETQKLLGSAYRYLRNKRAYPVNHPLMRNVRRLGRAIRG